ncbi:MAG: glutamate--tRNA ligase [Pirellulaceae bacterium]|nr:MAG: glutamate--tRNA ligase [Pirellulaceae bacterium]
MVRTRFAPSPTGYLHIGGVRTALYNWLVARRHGGQFILRIDDTDKSRQVDEALRPILEGLRWLGLDWDEGPDVGGPHGPYYQSQRAERYRAAVEELLRRGAAYRDYALPEEYEQERRQAETEKRLFIYSRRWMAESPEQARRWEAEGRRPVVRLKMPRSGTCRFFDAIRGWVEVPWENEPDHVVQRSDGTCLYHLANVVDDFDFQITHVIRAVEHLSNTPRQIFIAQSLGYPLPVYAHLPFVAEPGSQNKLSKRHLDRYLKHPDFRKLYDLGEAVFRKLGRSPDPLVMNPVLVDFYRAVGFLPEAVLNYILLLGWSWDDKTEEFTREEMIERFDLERVNRAPASFDPAKLLAFQERYMKRLAPADKLPLVWPFVEQAGWTTYRHNAPQSWWLRLLEAIGDRLKVAGDVLQFDEFFVADDQLVYDPEAVKKHLVADEARATLVQVRQWLLEVEPFEAAALEQHLKAQVQAAGWPLRRVVHPLRVAVTGKTVGLGLFDTLELLGRASCLARIDRALCLSEQMRTTPALADEKPEG